MAIATATLPPDCHLLTPIGPLGSGRAAEFGRAALDAGLSEVTVAARAPNAHGYDPSGRMGMAEFPRYLDFHRELSATPGLAVRLGIELDFYQGCYVQQDAFLKEHPFDLVLGTVRFQSFWARQAAEKTLFDKDEVVPVWRRYFKLVGLLVECGLYDAVSCLDLPKQQGRMPKDAVMRDCVLPALDKMAQYGIALEVNTSGLADPVREIYPSAQILAWARERNLPICFGSGATAPGEVGRGFEQAVRMAKDAGYLQAVRFEKRRKASVLLP